MILGCTTIEAWGSTGNAMGIEQKEPCYGEVNSTESILYGKGVDDYARRP
eukprot:COSAG06_NODE_99_length_24156_cov_20.889549_17_plen_50_part_00